MYDAILSKNKELVNTLANVDISKLSQAEQIELLKGLQQAGAKMKADKERIQKQNAYNTAKESHRKREAWRIVQEHGLTNEIAPFPTFEEFHAQK